jgi:hypothetical protein
MLAGIGTLFEPTSPERRTDRTQLLWLGLIVLAGAVLRFWGLGDIGLHREDEDTSALPVLGLLETGTSQFPSGLIYYRAVIQTYLMAGCVWLFGNTEWALRLPSVFCGLLLIVLGWQMGKRFLQPTWNLAFAAVLAFLPGLILASQTARMYIFMLASLAALAIMIFRWERTGRTLDFVGAVAVMWLAVQFQTLSLFAGILFLFPALLHGRQRQWVLGIVGVLMSALAFKVIDEWTGQYFPQTTTTGFASILPATGPTAAALVPPRAPLMLLAGGLGILALAWLAARAVRGFWPALITGVLAAAGLAAVLFPALHVTALLLLAFAVVLMRHSERPLPSLLWIGAGAATLTALQVMRLHGAGIESFKNIAGVMLGWPSVWAYVRLTEYSVFALLLSAALVGAALWRLACKRPAPDFVLWLVLGGWLPLLAVGTFVWNPPPRYIMVTLLPLLLASMAALQWAASKLPAARPLLLLTGAVLLVNPVAFARTWNAGYKLHPDHKGAAEYVLSQHPEARDIIVAEDAIVQLYYLKRVDYWLMARSSIVDFVWRRNGEIRDIYTDSRVIGSGADLQAVLDQPDRGAIYIVGSGENQEDGRRYMRGPELSARLTSGEFPVVYEGRDGLTKVWRIPPPNP